MKQVSNLKTISIFLALFFMKSAFAFNDNWKVLIYMQADNDLYEYALKDINEIVKRNESLNVEVIVRLDTPGEKGIYDLGFYKSSDEQITELNINDYLINYYLEDYFPSQSENLEQFVADYSSPNSKTALIMWGHGEGYTSDQFAQFGGIALDDFPKSKLTLKEVREILETYNLINSKNLDILIMDACLMQTLESAFEVQEYVEYYIGSTQIQNFNGLPYTEFLNEFDKSKTTFDIVKLIPSLYLNSLDNDSTETMSSINTIELQNVFYPTFNKTFKKIVDYFKEQPLEIISLKSYLQTLPFFLGNSKDIATLLIGLKEYFHQNEIDLFENDLNDSLQAINQVVISSVAGSAYFDDNTAYFRGHFKGLGLWVPVSTNEYMAKIEDFKTSSVYTSNSLNYWYVFLSQLFKKQAIGLVISMD